MESEVVTSSRICPVTPGSKTGLNQLLKPRTIFMGLSLALILLTSGLVYLWMRPPPFVPPPPPPTPTPHGAIAIDGDADFMATALLEGWPGDGSPQNPYIIDGLDIDLGGEPTHCISIRNTRVSFAISNCNLTGAGYLPFTHWGAGIKLYNVTNGVLINNKCSSNQVGIILSDSDSTTVANNTCNSNVVGIHLRDSDSNIVSDNTCNNNTGSGIRLGESYYNTVTNNICNGNEIGIGLGNSLYNNGWNNTCLDNTEYGIIGEFETDEIAHREFVAREFLWFLAGCEMLLVASVIAFAKLRGMEIHENEGG